MPLADALVRATVAALATVVPISESAHRALVGLWLGPAGHDEPWRSATAFGCLTALSIVLRERLWPCLGAVSGLLRTGRSALGSDGGRDLAVLALAASVSLTVEGALGARAAALESSPLVVGVGLIATAVTLLSTIAAPPPRLLRPSLLGAAFVGLAHGLGVVPGASQVGGAFVALCWLGIRGWRAAELALLVTLPTLLARAIAGAATLLGGAPFGARPALLGLAGGALGAAIVAALGALGWRSVADRERSLLFVLWVAPLAVAMLGYAYATAG